MFVQIDALAAFVLLLGLDRQRGNGPCLQPLQADRFTRLLAEAVLAKLDAL